MLQLTSFCFIFILSFASWSKPQTTLWITNGQQKEFNFPYSRGSTIYIQNALPQVKNIAGLTTSTQESFSVANLSCTNEVKLFGLMKKYQGQNIQFHLYHSEALAKKLKLEITDLETRCTLVVEDKKIQILPEYELHPAVSRLREYQKTGSTGNARLLKDPYQSLNARFRAIMGYDLSTDEYLKKDPNMFLDFKRAPQLDLIIFNTLQIMNDFAGRIILRGLSFHAKRGTRVTFISSQALVLPQERIYFEKFRKENPEIQFELYHAESTLSKPLEVAHSIHRTSHVKALITYSESHPELNTMIAGGRNQSEMYFYPQKPNNTNFPDIIQWGSAWYPWGYFDDLDFVVGDGFLLRSVARDLLRYNENEFDVFQKKDLNDYIISYPLKSGQKNLENAYVELFTNAQKSLLIVSPYLNFTEAISNALDAAKERGVKIQFITNLSVENDFMPSILQPAMYKEFRKIMKKHELIFYKKHSSTLHVKAILVDNENLILGSVNLNKRSFLHDTEFSVQFKDPTLVQDFKQMLEKDITPYLRKVELSELPPKSITELLIGPFMGVF